MSDTKLIGLLLGDVGLPAESEGNDGTCNKERNEIGAVLVECQNLLLCYERLRTPQSVIVLAVVNRVDAEDDVVRRLNGLMAVEKSVGGARRIGDEWKVMREWD